MARINTSGSVVVIWGGGMQKENGIGEEEKRVFECLCNVIYIYFNDAIKYGSMYVHIH